MTFVKDISAFAGESTITARSQTEAADTQAQPWPAVSMFGDFKLTSTKYYERAPVLFTGLAELTGDFATDLIYERIWVTQVVPFGTIVEYMELYTYIWNAYIERAVDITSVSDPDEEGVDIFYEAPPVTLQPNEEKSYLTAAYVTGPAEQYTTYAFTVDGTAYYVLITGERVLAFPFMPNWRHGVNFTYGYETVIATARNLYEQRRSMWPSPRRDTSFRVEENDVLAEKLANTIRFATGRYVGVNIYHELFWTNDTLTGETSFTSAVDLTNYYNLQNFSTKLIIMEPATAVGELKTIESIVGNTITLTSEIQKSFDPATAVIMPIFIGSMTNHTIEHLTNTLAAGDIQFSENFLGLGDTSPPSVPTTTQTLTSAIIPNMRDSVRRTIALARDLFEFFGSPPTLLSLKDRRNETIILSDNLDNKTNIAALTDFFCSHRGRLARFWLDTEQEAFTLVSSQGVSAVTFDVKRNGYEKIWSTDDYLYVIPNTGTPERVRVTDVVEDDLNDELTITFTPGLTFATSPTLTLRISRSYLVRFDIDKLTMSFLSTDVARVPLRFYELPNERDEVT